MCYKKPGPRCSAHTKQRVDKLRSHRESLLIMMTNSAVGSNSFELSNELLAVEEKLRDAEEEFHTTPEGMKELNEMINSPFIDAYDREFLLFKREYCASVRESQIAAYKAKYGQDITGDPAPDPELKEAKPIFVLDTRDRSDGIFDPFPEDWNVQQATSKNKQRRYGALVVYDRYECQGTSCESEDYDNYCRDGAFEGLRIEEFNSREYLANRFSVQDTDITDEMVEELDNINPLQNLFPRGIESYYGEDRVQIDGSELFRNTVSNIFLKATSAARENS